MMMIDDDSRGRILKSHIVRDTLHGQLGPYLREMAVQDEYYGLRLPAQ